MLEWYKAIYALIDTQSDNQSLIIQKEVGIAKQDQLQIFKSFGRLKMELSRCETTTLVSNQALQKRLIEFVDCPLISDLLPNVITYMLLSESVYQ
jgi:hypothetical protein